MVRLGSMLKADMEVASHFVRKCLKEFLEELDVEIADKGDRWICLVNQISAIAQIKRHANESLIHGKKEKTVPLDSGLVTQSFPEGLAQANAHVFDQMVIVYLDISFGFDGKVEESMPGKKGQHMIEKRDSRRNFSFSRAIKREFYLDLGFLRISAD